MFAAVELGTNGFRLHVGQPVGGRIEIVRTAHDPLRWAVERTQGGDRGPSLGAGTIGAALACLARFSAILREYDLQAVRAVATNTLRIAQDADTFLPLARRALGYPVEIISGEEEGRLVYLGVARALARPGERRLVIDIGSASTEIVRGQGDDIAGVESFSIGAQRQGAAFFADGKVDATSFGAAVMSVRARLHDAAGQYGSGQVDAVYVASGTVRLLDELIGEPGGDGAVSYERLAALRGRLFEAGPGAGFALPAIAPERAAVTGGALAVLLGVMQELGIARVTPVAGGLRLGVLSDLENQSRRCDRRDGAVQAFMARFGVDRLRADRTAAIAARLYDALAPQSGQHRPYLLWACLLHEIGQSVSRSNAHRHGAYLVEHADLPGFTAREQRLLGLLVLAQTGNLAKVRELLADPDLAKAVVALRLAVLCMHAGIDPAAGAWQLRMGAGIELQASPAWLGAHPTMIWWLDKEYERWDEVGVTFRIRSVEEGAGPVTST